jgi:hypothetical protein
VTIWIYPCWCHCHAQAGNEKALAPDSAVVTGAVEAMSRVMTALVPLGVFSSVHVPLRLLPVALERIDCRGHGRSTASGSAPASESKAVRSHTDGVSERRRLPFQRSKVPRCCFNAHSPPGWVRHRFRMFPLNVPHLAWHGMLCQCVRSNFWYDYSFLQVLCAPR